MGLAIKRKLRSDLIDELLDLSNKNFFEYFGKSWGIQNPIDVLGECIRNKEWFRGVVLSATFLEGIGARTLSFHFGSQINAKKIRRLNLDAIVILLFASKIIEHSTYLKMIEIKNYRNDIVHPTHSPFDKPKPQEAQSKRIIEMAMKCLNRLILELQEEINEISSERNQK